MNFHKMEVDTDGTLQLLVFFLIIIISIGLISFFSILVRDAVVQRLVKWTWVGRGGGKKGCAVSHLSADRHCGLEPLSES